MKKVATIVVGLLTTLAAAAQTLNVTVGSVTYQFPAAQTGDMTYSGGTSLTIMGKTFALSDISSMSVDNTEVTNNLVAIAYNGTSATVTVAGNIAQYVEPTVSGAYVSIAQSNTDAVDNDEITYQLSGTSTDGQFDLSGSYKCTVSLAGVNLTCATGSAINITNKKRIQISAKNGTTNTLTDCSGGSQKGCIYSKGQIQLQGNGTLTVVGKTKHAIKSGDYIAVKNLTLNVTGAVGDGISSNKYFLMESGTVTISGVSDDGIQCDLETDDAQTAETTNHEDENSGNVYLEGGTLTVTVTGQATKGVKSAGAMKISGGTIKVTTSGNGYYDSTERDAKGCAGLKSDGAMTISGGTITLTSSGTGGKCIKCDGALTISGGTINATSTGSNYKYSSYYTASAKAIKSDGALVITNGTIVAKASSHEAIESKSTITISGGDIYAQSSDDAINSASTFTISGGKVMGYSTGNDGLDANGNFIIEGGVVYAIGARSPEMAIDANTEGGYKLTVKGGIIFTCGPLEGGSTLTQACYSTTSINKNVWYSLTNGSETYCFKTPSSLSVSTLVVSASSKPTVKSGVTVSGGTTMMNGMGYASATVSGGSEVSLSSYSSGGGGGGGGGGGHGPWW
ncbi:MAG: carbohydrate-binding domain-containing protein [Prevotella sp.]|nr:carbohydrate-binding domain-containing protein [Prevotella sp.]